MRLLLVKPYAINFLSGVLCLPATYRLTRSGNPITALLIVMGIAAAGAIVALPFESKRPVRTTYVVTGCSFLCGALLAEAGSFFAYYLSYGAKDPYGIIGLHLALLECIGISIVGCLTAIIARRLLERA